MLFCRFHQELTAIQTKPFNLTRRRKEYIRLLCARRNYLTALESMLHKFVSTCYCNNNNNQNNGNHPTQFII
ncbi:uncharacterized protein Dsimw501_GD29434 [Drosophila simulans]|uniref:Uncharacterized protein n=1 Tax=Drosophila simulans TaxID=7240 RepID=A0A0J9R5F8_DROSI|nr:uncharacterized protein Dsimw501_GD29434 [Drosophila simulans]